METRQAKENVCFEVEVLLYNTGKGCVLFYPNEH